MSIGLKFGKLTVVDEFIYQRSGTRTWVCECQCGARVNRQPSDLRNGKYTNGCQSCARGLDLTGQVFHKLTVLNVSRRTRRGTYWNCRCECGRECERIVYHLKDVKRGACGDCSAETWGEWNKTHGFSRSPIYVRWKSMHDRCANPKHASYKNYGGKGVKVCAEWREIDKFAGWALKNGFHPALELDRADPQGNYDPANCQWITKKENVSRMIAYHRVRGTGIFAP